MSKQAEIQKLLDEAGLALDKVVTTGKHPKMYVRAPDGRTGVFTVPASASDHRALKNKRAQLRAFAAGRPAYNTRG